MMSDKTFFKSRLRTKGQVTVPSQVRAALGVDDGDDLIFHIDEHGRVVVSRAQVIPPEQAWFWTERWQRLEREAQADIDAGRTQEFSNLADALSALDQYTDDEADAED
jgi:bifunctional DNA-binding transcriptional regulator/antitoxin component of YhaV-PrlF toxin-antitoxin module